MKFVATTLLALIGSTAAFAPVSRRSSSNSPTTTAVNAFADDLVGALDPVGFFDPLGFAEKADDNTLKRYREAELTHGRVASKCKVVHLYIVYCILLSSFITIVVVVVVFLIEFNKLLINYNIIFITHNTTQLLYSFFHFCFLFLSTTTTIHTIQYNTNTI